MTPSFLLGCSCHFLDKSNISRKFLSLPLKTKAGDCIQAGPNTFGPRVPQFWQKFFWCFSTWKILVIRVCQKYQKCKISEKPGFWRNYGYFFKTVRSIFMIFWHKTPLTINKRLAKKIFQNFLPLLRNNQLCKNWNFSKTRYFIFLKFKT